MFVLVRCPVAVAGQDATYVSYGATDVPKIDAPYVTVSVRCYFLIFSLLPGTPITFCVRYHRSDSPTN